MPAPSKPTLMLIDGHSLAFRAFYALPTESFQTRDGQYTNAVHGFLAMLLNLLTKENPDALAVAFDVSRFSFRNETYPEYKATRGETPAEFKGQVPLLQDALHAMGVVTLEKENFEADDILATLATRGAEAGYHVLVVSGDRDTIQLVNDDVTLLYPSKQGVSELTRYDTQRVLERYGIRPEQYPDVAALVGETSDNLPGVPKVGEKTAVKWLLEFGSLDEILAHQDQIAGKVGESLREHAHLAERNRRLNHLVRDVPLNVSIEELERKPINADAVRESFARLEFRTLLARVLKLAGEENGGDASLSAPTNVEPSQEHPESRLLLDEELEQWLKRQASAAGTPVGVHIEHGHDGALVGIATQREAIHFPWRPGSQDARPFEEWMMTSAPKVFFDAKAQLRAHPALLEHTAGISGDLLIAGWLLRPQTPEKTIRDAVYRFLGEQLPEPSQPQLLPEEGSEMSPGLIAWYVLRGHIEAEARFDEHTAQVYRSIELPLIPILARMELVGIGVDRERLNSLAQEFEARANEFEREALSYTKKPVNLSSPKQLQEVLFEELGMPKTRATKTGFSTDAAALAELQASHPHPFLDALLAHRDSTKLKQIVEGLIKSISADQRIHSTFLQTGTSTGRLSSAEPNLQNIPIRTEDGRRIRECFVAQEPFQILISADYSQIEMRIMAHLSADAGLIEAFHEGEDLHRFVGARIFNVAPEDVTAEMRGQVKAMSYGLAYGLSAYGLAKQLNLTPAEAKTLMGDYFQRFGGVRDYLRSVVEQAKRDTFTVTLFGRRRPFPDLGSPNRVVRENAERAALNAPIQGTAADIMKRAMISIDQKIRESGLTSRMLLQVHDELIFEVTTGEQDALTALVREGMAHAAELTVPLDVQIGSGVSWHDAAH